MTVEFGVEQGIVEARLAEICGKYLLPLRAGVGEAAAYGVKSPGKRLRPLLLQLAYRACAGRGDASLLSCAPELIHAYSLIHDDLPCMDDDDMRRGRPTVHRVYGSPLAVVGGAALIPVAVLVSVEGCRQLPCATERTREIVRVLLVAAGAGGMIGGQVSDLAGEGGTLTLADRERIHAGKTAALIVASLEIGALAAGATQAQVLALRSFGNALGLAFQITDDVLDVTSTSGLIGKATGRDAVLGKSTYPALLGVEGARSRAQDLIDGAVRSLSDHRLLTRELQQVANFMVTRTS